MMTENVRGEKEIEIMETTNTDIEMTVEEKIAEMTDIEIIMIGTEDMTDTTTAEDRTDVITTTDTDIIIIDMIEEIEKTT